MRDVFITHHAKKRFRQRVARGRTSEVVDQLKHAVEIARPLNAIQIAWLFEHRWGLCGGDRSYLFCPVESLLLVMRKGRNDGELILLTVAKIPTAEEMKARKLANWTRNRKKRLRQLRAAHPEYFTATPELVDEMDQWR